MMCPKCGCESSVIWRDGSKFRCECRACKHIWTEEATVHIFEIIIAAMLIMFVFAALIFYIMGKF